MQKYRHAKVAPYQGLKLSTVGIAVGLLVMGAVSAKAFTSPSTEEVVVVPVTTTSNGCSTALIGGYACRLDAAINEATR